MQTESTHKHGGVLIFVVVILGTAGVLFGWQEYNQYLTNQATAKYLCSQGTGQCSPFYAQDGNFFIKGASNQTALTIPPDCGPVYCMVSFNVTINHPERLVMVYSAPVRTYAELDFHAPTGDWDEVMHSPSDTSGFILAYTPCSFGTYRYWFSGSATNQSQYGVSVNFQIQSFNFTGACG